METSNQMDQNQMGQKCPCPHHKMVPIFIVLIGLDFLLGALNVLTAQTVAVIWPILVILAGLQKIFGNRCKCCGKM